MQPVSAILFSVWRLLFAAMLVAGVRTARVCICAVFIAALSKERGYHYQDSYMGEY